MSSAEPPPTTRPADGSCQIGSRPLLSRQNSDVETFTDAEGHAIVAAYVPSTVPPVGLAVIDTLVLPDLIADIDQASYQNLLVIGAAALVALVSGLGRWPTLHLSADRGAFARRP